MLAKIRNNRQAYYVHFTDDLEFVNYPLSKHVWFLDHFLLTKELSIMSLEPKILRAAYADRNTLESSRVGQTRLIV